MKSKLEFLKEKLVLLLIDFAIHLTKSGLTDDDLKRAKKTQEWYLYQCEP